MNDVAIYNLKKVEKDFDDVSEKLKFIFKKLMIM